MREEYQKLGEDERAKRLLGYLQAESEDTRWMAAQIIYDEKAVGRPVAAAALEMLRGMVSDNSAEVRKKVAQTLATINDPGALNVLLAQLAQEKDADVRQAIVEALLPIQDLRTVEPLLKGLDDESFSVAQAAADALREKAETLRKPENAAVAAQVAQKLQQRLEQTAGNVSQGPLRQSIVEAMARVAQPSQLSVFSGLLSSERELPNVRRAALRGLGLLANPNSANMIIAAINDPNAGVRLEAMDALKTTASWNHANTIAERLSPGIETDTAVQEKTWELLTVLFEKAPERDLAAWAERFNKRSATDQDNKRRLAILLVLEKKLEERQRAGDAGHDAPEHRRDAAAAGQAGGGCDEIPRGPGLLDRAEDQRQRDGLPDAAVDGGAPASAEIR